jgi:hypothetical protein
VRRFGTEVSDLDVNFASGSPFLVTELLRRCASVTEQDAWNLSVGARTEALVTLATLSGPKSLGIELRCPNAACREALEVGIEPSELRAWCTEQERESVSVPIAGRNVILRRPTGADQRNWLGTAWPDAGSARRAMLETLLDAPLNDALDPQVTRALEDELSRIDPLVGFSLSVPCPACGETANHPLDLERQALAVLKRIHERLFEGVARLAARFHWTEAEIFVLPAWRRERYLAFAEASP